MRRVSSHSAMDGCGAQATRVWRRKKNLSFAHRQTLFSLLEEFTSSGFMMRFQSPNTPARAISFHGDSVAENFITGASPIESDRPHWEGWESTQ